MKNNLRCDFRAVLIGAYECGMPEMCCALQMYEQRQTLPVFAAEEEVCNTIANNRVTIIRGQTGCGKTTQIPQIILDQYISTGCGSQCSIICTQVCTVLMLFPPPPGSTVIMVKIFNIFPK